MKKILLLFFAVLMISSFTRSANIPDSLERKYWMNLLRNIKLTPNLKPVRYQKDIKIELQGEVTKEDRMIVDSIVRQLKPLIQTVSISRVDTGGNLVIILTRYHNYTFRTHIVGDEIDYKIEDLRGEDKIKYHSIKIGKQDIKVVVVSGISNAQKVLEDIENKKLEVHLMEVMACPNGCIAGGGQIVPQDYKAIKARMKSIYDTDKIESIKAAHQNPAIKDLYDNYLIKPLSEKSRQILHTHYSVRNVLK